MKRLTLGVAIVAALAAAAWVAYQQRSVQEWMMTRAAAVMMNAGPGEALAGLEVIVCGSASPLGNVADRAQACLAVRTPQHLFLFDVGDRSAATLARLGVPLAGLRAVFLTHLHSDHFSDLADVRLATWVGGRTDPLPVHGPAGTARIVEGLNTAYELDSRYRIDHHGTQILAPSGGRLAAREHAPGRVWQDDQLTITAIAVDHDPIEPAFGYRVDYLGRSVVISGDTVVVDSLLEASRGADVVFHDALSRPLLDPMIAAASAAGRTRITTIMVDVIDYHADSQKLDAAYAATDVKQLILYHLVPAPPNDLARRLFRHGLRDSTLLAYDGMRVGLPIGSTEVLIDP